MRTIFLTLILLLTLTACGGKEDAPVNDPAAEAAAAEASETATTEEGEGAETPAPENDDKSIVDADIQLGPVGDIRLADGRVLELTEFQKIGKYYIYISGKLNGRSSTVVSLTRLEDLKRWKSIEFQDQHTFTIITRGDRQLRFADSRIYIGSDSADTYTFHTTPPESYQSELVTVNKRDVKAINIIQDTNQD